MQNQRVVNRGIDDRRCSLETRCGVIVYPADRNRVNFTRISASAPSGGSRRCVEFESTRTSFEIDERILDERRVRRSQVLSNAEEAVGVLEKRLRLWARLPGSW